MTSTSAVQHRKFKQARLGEVQKQILNLLAEHKVEAARLGKEDSGLQQSELLAHLHGYVQVQGRQWAVTVYTQLLRERGEGDKAVQILLENLQRVGERLHQDALQALEYAKEPYNGRLNVEMVMLAETHLKQIGRLYAQLQVISRSATHAEPDAVEALYTTAIELAQQLVQIAYFHLNGFLFRDTSMLPSGAPEEATSALGKHQASLSRALRLLREHRLVERKVIVEHRGPHLTQEVLKHVITAAGLQRLREDHS